MDELVVLGPLELRLPAAWERAAQAVFLAPVRSFCELPTLSEVRGTRANVYAQLAVLLAGYSLDQLVEEAVGARRAALPQHRTLLARERSVAGLPASEHVFTFEAPATLAEAQPVVMPGTPIQQAQVLFITGAMACNLVFTSLPGFFDEDRRQFDALLDSIQPHAEAA